MPAVAEHSDITATWFAHLYRDVDHGWLSLFSVDQRTGERVVRWRPSSDTLGLSVDAHELAEHGDVWFGVATRRGRLPGNQRGGRAHCAQITAVWADVDVAGPNHADSTALPPTVADARHLIADFPRPPSFIVHTGGGLQPWWLLTEPVDVADAEPFLRRWEATWDEMASMYGWRVDHVANVDRIMRIPGTWNRKGMAEGREPAPVVLVEERWDLRYDLSDLDEDCVDPPAPPAAEPRERVPYIGPKRPGDAFNSQHTPGELLGALGFVLARRDRNGDEHWTRPGKERREGTSVTVYAEDGHITNYSDTVTAMWPAFAKHRPFDAFGLYAVTTHAGDFGVASATLAARGYGERPVHAQATDLIGDSLRPAPPASEDQEAGEVLDGRSSWRPVDLRAHLDGAVAKVVPTMLRRIDGRALVYPGRITTFMGESGSGKSWCAMHLMAEAIRDGGTCWLIDYEDRPEGIIGRLRALGLTDDEIAGGVLYIQPETAFGIDARIVVAELLAEGTPQLVVIDSTGEALAVQGANPNADNEVAAWFVSLPAWLARRGPAVVNIDHIVKTEADGPTLYPIGSQRKRAAAHAVYRVDQAQALGIGKEGILKITCAKDRAGTWSKGQVVAEVHVASDPTGEKVLVDVRPPSSIDPETGRFRPTVLMSRVSEFLAKLPNGASMRTIRGEVRGNERAVVEAVQTLVDEGYLIEQERSGRGGGTNYRLVHPFHSVTERGEDVRGDSLRNELVPTGAELVPSEKAPVQDELVPLVPTGAKPVPGTTSKLVPSGAPTPPTGGHPRHQFERPEHRIEDRTGASDLDPMAVGVVAEVVPVEVVPPSGLDEVEAPATDRDELRRWLP